MKTRDLYLGTFRKQSNRCPAWNYNSEGIYFITINTKFRSKDFGYVENGKMVLNTQGNIIQYHWNLIPKIYPEIILDSFMIMPDHFHCILHIDYGPYCRDVSGRDVSQKRLYNNFNKNKNQPRPNYHGNHPKMSAISAKPKSISTIIRSFKGSTTKDIAKPT